MRLKSLAALPDMVATPSAHMRLLVVAERTVRDVDGKIYCRACWRHCASLQSAWSHYGAVHEKVKP
jgi:hypothetical protein